MNKAQSIVVEKLRKAYSRNGGFTVEENVKSDQVLVTFHDGLDDFTFVETIDIRGIGYPK